jgi:hypothetical protein
MNICIVLIVILKKRMQKVRVIKKREDRKRLMLLKIITIGQVEKEMEKIARRAIENITKRVLEDFKKDYIQKYVYDSHPSNKVYKNPRGQEFKEAWNWTPIKTSLTELTSTMWYDYSKMTTIPNYFISGKNGGISIGIHGSEVGGWDTDERPYLMDTLNKVGYSSSLWVSVARTHAYWNEFINNYVYNGTLRRIINEEFSKLGITFHN